LASVPFMRDPTPENNFDVGDMVEVLADHDKAGDRVRGWVRGIVVQVDAKMVAVQFRGNVYLTDGWMVPDHILWFPQHSANLRAPLKSKTGRPVASRADLL
jgi:hypothetical protein